MSDGVLACSTEVAMVGPRWCWVPASRFPPHQILQVISFPPLIFYLIHLVIFISITVNTIKLSELLLDSESELEYTRSNLRDSPPHSLRPPRSPRAPRTPRPPRPPRPRAPPASDSPALSASCSSPTSSTSPTSPASPASSALPVTTTKSVHLGRDHHHLPGRSRPPQTPGGPERTRQPGLCARWLCVS